MSSNNSTSAVGIGFPGLLAIVFITLKLCGVINWSWWLVTLPLWLVPAILLGVAIICFVAAIIVKTCEELSDK